MQVVGESGTASAYQLPRLSPQARRRLAVFGALGVATYALALVATLPARVALDWAGAPGLSQGAVGTAWNGEAALGNGVVAAWKVSPLRSIVQLSLAADVSVRGPDTELAGEARVRPGRLVLAGLQGRAGWGLVDALAPKLPFSCEVSLRVDLPRAVLAGRRSEAQGQLTSGPGACRSKTGDATSLVPTMRAVASVTPGGFSAWASPEANPGARWAQATLTRQGRLVLDVTATGAAALPAGAVPGPVSIEIEL